MSGVNNNLSICVGTREVGHSPGVVTRRDQLTESVRLEIKRLMLHHGDMQQIELAMRAGETKQRIQRFISGQMPYPPMDFLDRLFRVFGKTLIDGLTGAVKPVKQLPILREDVQALADTCAAMEAEGVAAVQHLASTLRDAGRKAGSAARGASAPAHHMPRTNGKRRTRKD
jgi:transcriptional regulator with XRE-family HTH domain